MLKNNWYVAAESSEVGQQPIRVRMLGRNFALFRDAQGNAACVSDVCPHRGGSLGRYGKVKDGQIECPYHGWRFNEQGVCTLIPALGPDGAISQKARIDSYPTQEKYGMIWAFLGDLPEQERPPLPEFPEYDDHDTWRCISGRFFWRAHYARVIENGIDMAHAAFVHGSVFGNADDPRIPSVDIEEHEWGAATTVELERPPLQGIWRYIYKERPRVRVDVSFHMSGMNIILRQRLNARMRLALFDINTPVDEEHTRTYWVLARNFLKSPLADFDSHRRNMMIFEQDRRIVEEIKPELVPALSDEVSVRSDGLQIAFRRKREQMIERGWQLDGSKLAAQGSHRAFVIPGPGRRDKDQRWSLRPVPLVKPKKASGGEV